MSKRKNKRNKLNLSEALAFIFFAIIVGIYGYFGGTKDVNAEEQGNQSIATIKSATLENIPEYQGSPYVEINNNIPEFSESDYTTEPFEKYSELDSLGRCGVAYANICKEVMPADGETRGAISSVKPTGWQTAKYPGVVDGNYLYNRCHLIGYQLAGENANPKNLITGTRYMNVTGMLPFENAVAEYIQKNSKKHVLYRVTPIFEGNNLVADGVQMEASSVEDQGKSVSFNVFVYNVQPGVSIDYTTGESKLESK